MSLVLRPDTVLQRALDLQLRLGKNEEVEISLEEHRVVRGGEHALDVLAVFDRPTTFSDALQRLARRAASGTDWAMLATAIRSLAAEGVLVTEDGPTPKVKAGGGSFSGAPVHIRMLNDSVRSSRLIAAINAVVRPDDIVVEAGTGTGVLAVAAARAGARHVYAIEAGHMASVARELARANGVAERVTVVEGWSSAVRLPERGDVFVSETVGNAAFDEDLLATATDARQRLLKPGARMIPSSLSLNALPAMAPVAWLGRQMFAPTVTETWRDAYGIDFSALCSLPVDYGMRGLIRPHGEQWPWLAAPLALASARFAPSFEVQLECSTAGVAQSAGELNALVVYFEAELAPGITLSTDPRGLPEEYPNSWGNPAWLVPAVALRSGDRFQVNFKWRERGQHQLEVERCGA